MKSQPRRESFPIRGNYIQGQFHYPKDSSEISGEWTSKSPADTADELAVVPIAYKMIDPAVQAARKAFAPWKSLAATQRRQLLGRLKEQILLRQNSLMDVMAREVGRPLWDAKSEVTQALQFIESWEESSDFNTQSSSETTPASNAHLIYHRVRPRGVFTVITPFSLPLLTPLSHLLPTLLLGNTLVWKPSQKAPVLSQLLAECFESSDLPPGVFNLLQGDSEMGRRLCVHEGIDGILFTGTYEVANRIKQDTLHHHWKVLVTECGGKNVTLLWDPQDLEKALYPIFVSAYLSAGQRAHSTARILVQEPLLDRFVERFHERAKAFSIGHPLENPFMGPLIDSTAVDRYMKFMGIAAREGAELVMRGKTLEFATPGNYVAPSICKLKNPTLEITRKSVYQQSELFGPNVAIIGVSSLDEAIALANATHYGLVSSVFSQDRSVFEKCLQELQYSQIHWNTPTTDFHPLLSGSGLKKSGNHFTTDLRPETQCLANLYSLEKNEAEVKHGDYPGLHWK